MTPRLRLIMWKTSRKCFGSQYLLRDVEHHRLHDHNLVYWRTDKKNSLNKGWSKSFECLLSWDNLSIFYEDFLGSVEFLFLVKLNDGFDVYVLNFGLIVRAFGIQVAAELFDTLLDIKSRAMGHRRKFDF